MKHLLLLFLVIPLLASCQRYDIEADAICWKTNGVDSNLLRLTQVTSLGATRIVGYVNTSGVTVSPTDGELLYGVCECCNPTPDTTTTESQVISFSHSQPTQNPLNPKPNCQSTAIIEFEDSVDSVHVSFTLNGNTQPYLFFPDASPRYARADLVMDWGSGLNELILSLTNSFGTEIQTRYIDCGGQ